MYIKSFTRYIKEQLDSDKSQGEILQFQLREFNNKKKNLKDLVMSNVDTDKDISRNYNDIIKDNPFLSSYGNMLKIDVAIKRKEIKLEEYAEDLQSLQNDTSLLGQLSDESDRESQQSNIETQTKEKNDQIKEEQNSIKELQEKIRLMEEGLREFIKEKTEELKSIQKNVII